MHRSGNAGLTSSATNRMPRARQKSATIAKNPGAGTIKPPSPWIGSTTTQATASAPIWLSTRDANWRNASEAQFSAPDDHR